MGLGSKVTMLGGGVGLRGSPGPHNISQWPLAKDNPLWEEECRSAGSSYWTETQVVLGMLRSPLKNPGARDT